MITATNLLHHYSYRPVLQEISFEIATGELVAVMGPNGTGKSTILGLVAGTLFPLRGSIEIDGVKRRSTERAELEIRNRMAYMPDHPWLPSSVSGHDFLGTVGELYSIDPVRITEHSEQLLEVFNLADQARVSIGSYSNGQKKKFVIGAAAWRVLWFWTRHRAPTGIRGRLGSRRFIIPAYDRHLVPSLFAVMSIFPVYVVTTWLGIRADYIAAVIAFVGISIVLVLGPSFREFHLTGPYAEAKRNLESGNKKSGGYERL